MLGIVGLAIRALVIPPVVYKGAAIFVVLKYAAPIAGATATAAISVFDAGMYTGAMAVEGFTDLAQYLFQ